MERSKISELYDSGYAAAYDERFLTGPPWAAVNSDFEVELLGELLDQPDPHWLDVACGTGWFLSRFPAVERIGIPDAADLLHFRMREDGSVERLTVEDGFFEAWAWSIDPPPPLDVSEVKRVNTLEPASARRSRLMGRRR